MIDLFLSFVDPLFRFRFIFGSYGRVTFTHPSVINFIWIITCVLSQISGQSLMSIDGLNTSRFDEIHFPNLINHLSHPSTDF